MAKMGEIKKKYKDEWVLENDDAVEFFANMRRCTRCILPETFPGIKFDENGVCNYCLNYEPMKVLGEKELERVLFKYRDKDDKYDCLIQLSGGRDSSFVLHQIVKKYKMNALAVTCDFGCTTPEGIWNIKRIVDILGVDHVWIRDKEQIRQSKENIKIKFRGWLEKPSINMIVPVLISADKTLEIQMHKYAKKNKIPLMIVGSNSFEQEHFKTGFLGVFPNDRGEYSTYDKIRVSLKFLKCFLENPYNFHIPILKEYIVGAGDFFFDFFRPKGIEYLIFYDYIKWNEKEVLSTVYNQLDWKGASDDTTVTWRVDDAAYPLMNYIYYKLVGFTEHDEMYSRMIREGQITREEALKRCMSDHKPRLAPMMGFLKELNVTKEQLDTALETYREKLLHDKAMKYPET